MDCLIDRLINMDIAESAATSRSPSRIGPIRPMPRPFTKMAHRCLPVFNMACLLPACFCFYNGQQVHTCIL
jgi:hypothetical protein